MSTLGALHVSVSLGDKAVLADVSVRLLPGQVTAVIGANGAGKSTLLTCLAGLRRADVGKVLLGDSDVCELHARLRGQRIGYLPQTPEVAWPVTVRTVVELGRTPYLGMGAPAQEDNAAVDRALALTATVAMGDRIVDTLSGGERARVLLARVLAGEPEWLLADEPLAGLDPRHQIDVADLLQHMAHRGGRGVVITLHDLHVAARVADRIIVLAGGRVLCDAPPGDALKPETLERAYGIRTRMVAGETGPLIEILDQDK